MLTQAEHLEMMARYGATNYAPLPVVIAEASGAWVTDVNGVRYLDMLSAYSAMSHGHCHPELVATLAAQAARVSLTSRAFMNTELAPLCQALAELTGQDLVLPMNTGVEAVETAIKAARRWGYRQKRVPAGQAEIIVCANNFHGRTVTVVGFSTEEAYRTDFGPFTPGFRIVPYGDSRALEQAITPNTVAFLVEPIQGEGGILIPPAGYLEAAGRICDEHRVLLMLDEIQTGLCRTGKMFAYQHEALRPDVLILGKALGGGMLPISAVVASREVLGVFEPGSHGSTFGGNPLACAVARQAIEILVRDRLAERAAELGARAMTQLSRLAASHPDTIREVRGRGLLIGIELRPEAGGARAYCERLMKLGLLCKETHEHVIRIAPPLVIGEADLDWALDRIELAFHD